jgi:hypothetical protein
MNSKILVLSIFIMNISQVTSSVEGLSNIINKCIINPTSGNTLLRSIPSCVKNSCPKTFFSKRNSNLENLQLRGGAVAKQNIAQSTESAGTTKSAKVKGSKKSVKGSASLEESMDEAASDLKTTAKVPKKSTKTSVSSSKVEKLETNSKVSKSSSKSMKSKDQDAFKARLPAQSHVTMPQCSDT